MSAVHVIESGGGPQLLPPERAAAWMGILQAHAELTRAVDAAMAAHGLTFHSFDILARVGSTGDGHPRMSDLAEGSQLSLSRVSRIVDALQERGLVERRSCPGDSRVVRVTLTDQGRALVAAAQDVFLEVVQERYLGRLPEEDVHRLGDILSRLVDAPLSCPAASR